MLAAFVLMAALSERMEADIAKIERAASQSRMFRRLVAEADAVPRTAGALPSGVWARYEPEGPRLVFDPKLSPPGRPAQLELARELARAAGYLEASADRKTLTVAFELAYADPRWSRELARQLERGEGPMSELAARALADRSDPEARGLSRRLKKVIKSIQNLH